MKMKAHTLIMITSFIPVVVFKVIARVGDVTIGQARVAAGLGLILALAQFVAAKKYIKRTTYLEWAFLGFLAVGLLWLLAAPPGMAMLFVAHSTTLLYLVLFLVTLLPQALGYDPFTYAIAKRWYPETVWNTPQFRTINLHITYAWSAVFCAAACSSFLGDGRPVFSIILPLIFVLGFGLPFSMKYPDYYLKREFATEPADPSLFPGTARELISQMPLAFDPDAMPGFKATIQFDLSGEGGGSMFLAIGDRRCSFQEGEAASPVLTIRSSGDTWLKIARGEIDRPKALMDGLYKVEGDMGLLMKLGELFHRPSSAPEIAPTGKDSITRKGEAGMVHILAVQGSPRPKVSNTEVILQQFLKGAQSQGAVTETVYLKEKNIHSCIGCYTCWTKTPGVCVFKDDMPELLERVRSCNIVVYATPLYNFNMTALTKAFQERLLPLLDPHLVKQGDTYRHPVRYDGIRKTVLVSTCGFPEVSHFEALRQIFRHIERNTDAPLIGELLVPAAELAIKQTFMREKAEGIMKAAFRAGVEVVRDGKVSKETELEIQKPIVSADETAQMANIWWDSHLQGITRAKAQDGSRIEDMRTLLRGMALSLSRAAAGDLKATIQFDVTGGQPMQGFLSIGDGTCTFDEGRTAGPTLTVKTPYEVWIAIANKEKDGQQAFMAGEYKVEGDMSLLMRMSTLFGTTR
jgi:multimeric flavodoxin WrbA/putative sterol carrier protein